MSLEDSAADTQSLEVSPIRTRHLRAWLRRQIVLAAGIVLILTAALLNNNYRFGSRSRSEFLRDFDHALAAAIDYSIRVG
jgi:hypothetical protein